MIDKLIVDGNNIEITDKDKMPYTYAFSTAKTHTVKYALSDTDEICANAFANCTYMTSIKFPPEIKMIKRRAFENCVRLNNITIPKTIEYIGANVWNGCTGMTEIHFEDTVPPTNYSKVPDNCKVYIPNDSKYVEAKGTLDPDSVQYYTKTDYNMYVEAQAETLKEGETYYYDNWTSIAPNHQTIEEKNRITIDRIIFDSDNITTDSGTQLILKYTIEPANATNRKLYFKSDFKPAPSNPTDEGPIRMIDTSLEGEIIINAVEGRTGTVKFTIWTEQGINSTCTIKSI